MSETRKSSKTRVLVVEDSAVVRNLLIYLLESDPAIEVLAAVNDGRQALEVLSREQPDVITMDYHMPNMDGLATTRAIMETCPVPIVVVSGSSMPVGDTSATFRLLEAGALAVVEKPVGFDHPCHAQIAREMLRTVKLMADVKVVRRWAGRDSSQLPVKQLTKVPQDIRLVAIGASTGGPMALASILSGLAPDFPVPILIVQHIAAGFTAGLVVWLDQSTGFPVRLASNGSLLLPGHAYIAPEGKQMKLVAGNRVQLSDDGPENGHRPSVSILFRSVALILGRDAVGVLLTGMGVDGADALKLMQDKGAITFAQDEESSVVHGMPARAIALQAATHVLNPTQIAVALLDLVNNSPIPRAGRQT